MRMAQVVDGFANESDWIREVLWVETEFDSDGDGQLDRVHVSVVRQAQTEYRQGSKCPLFMDRAHITQERPV